MTAVDSLKGAIILRRRYEGKESHMEEEHLKNIDAKLGALLALEVERELKGKNGEQGDWHPLARLLAKAGFSTAEIATVFSKGQRAVQLAIQEGPSKPKSTGRTTKIKRQRR
jgi:hypothetical protein